MRNVISIATIIVAVMTVLLIAYASIASASLVGRTFTPEGGNITYEGTFAETPKKEIAANILTIFGGEKIVFLNATRGSVPVIVSGPYTKDGEKYSGEPFRKETLDSWKEWDSGGKPTKGYFEIEDTGGEGGWFEIISHSFTIELVGNSERVQEGKNFSIRLRGNEKEQGVMKLTIEDEGGYSITNTNGMDIYEILIAYNESVFAGFAGAPAEGVRFTADNELLFDTAKLDMEEGEYTIILEDFATEAEDTGEIKVEKRYLEVECDEEVVIGGEIIVIIKSSCYAEEATVTVEGIPEEVGIQQVILDDEGKKKVKIPTENLDYGTQRITVEVAELKETEYVTVTRESVSVEVQDNATVGDIVHIEGLSDSGDFAVFVIDNLFKGEARISNDGEFDWDWDTRGGFDGYQEINVFIVSDQSSFYVGERISEDWQRENGVDASAGIILLLPTFGMTAPECIAEGDDVVVKGEATGTDHVYIIVINSQGEVIFPANGIARATPVESGMWVESIQDFDTGNYAVISLHRGKDGRTDAIADGMWAAGSEGKTLEQRVAILESAMSSAGSDDIFKIGYCSVTTPQVYLKLPETVEIEDELIVRAETNVRDGEKALVSLSFNPDIVTTTATLVENGNLEASFNTGGLQPGRYNVKVDISGRAVDDKGILLVEKGEFVGNIEEETLTEGESLAETEATEKAIESEGKLNESQEKALEMPVNAWVVFIAILMATLVSILSRRLR